jgi:hypothetical protein
MMIDPQLHLVLHRQEQDERNRRLGHRAAIRATQASPSMRSSWQQLLRTGRRPARGSPSG